MTGSLPQEVRDCFSRFVTTEYTTIDARQQPITWPVTPYYADRGPTIDLTTGIGYPKKADDAARNPRVALLFSDPTGSGLERPAEVLVQGTAQIDDEDFDANSDRYIRESVQKLPATKRMHPPKFMRRPLRWYYARIYVKVRPERVFVWPKGDPTAEPVLHDAHIEEVRSGHVEEPPIARAPATGGGVPWDDRMQELGSRYPEAVLSWVAPDGFPLAVRLPIALDQGAKRVRIEVEPAGLPLGEGRACLTAHSHGPGFEWQENFQVRGDLVNGPSGWELVPHKLVGGFELPKGVKRFRSFVQKHRRFYRTAKSRLG
ncbi:MAG: pyridoxamine 5'-phosphate oxidase family protein [Solirubrobacterales bacterium]